MLLLTKYISGVEHSNTTHQFHPILLSFSNHCQTIVLKRKFKSIICFKCFSFIEKLWKSPRPPY